MTKEKFEQKMNVSDVDGIRIAPPPGPRPGPLERAGDITTWIRMIVVWSLTLGAVMDLSVSSVRSCVARPRDLRSRSAQI